MESLRFHGQARQVVINGLGSSQGVDTHNTPAESAGVEVVALFESKVTQTCLVPGQAFSLLVGLEDGSIYYLCAGLHDKPCALQLFQNCVHGRLDMIVRYISSSGDTAWMREHTLNVLCGMKGSVDQWSTTMC